MGAETGDGEHINHHLFCLLFLLYLVHIGTDSGSQRMASVQAFGSIWCQLPAYRKWLMEEGEVMGTIVDFGCSEGANSKTS